ncbi:MAG TPA: 1,4-dihydroxy-6-naphthoate synthase [Chitinophagaceae bacterium]|nr:1,4-dihydroxy-6-naphthoate synthase [Chitinophagaceae bacterium]
MNFTLGFSPCPNDTFIFDALVNKKIDTNGLDFQVRLEDVETLNEMALQQKLDFTKISYGVLPHILLFYKVLNSGSALGTGVGPLLISKKAISFDDVNDYTIAIPGENTTAHLLFSLAFPAAKSKIFLRYDEIENFVLKQGDKALGVIIHENRFTYAERGLHKIVDLGNFWEGKTGYPIPLGGIVGKKSIDEKLINKVDSLIKQSIEYAFSNYPAIPAYVQRHSQEMDIEVMKKHIDLYVNDYSITLGGDGKAAIEKLIEVFTQINQNSSTTNYVKEATMFAGQ